MSTFTPLDHGLSDSSVNLEGGPTVLAVWSLIMSRTDQDGVTTLNPKAIYLQWLESREPRELADVEAAWEFLAAPDPRSKNADEEGRRIIPTDDGRWFVVSHAKYRERYQLEKRRRQLAEAKRRQRARESAKGGDANAAGRPGPIPGPTLDTAPPADAGGGRVAERRVRVVGLDGKPREAPAYQPTAEYPTFEERRAAELEAMRLCSNIEGATGRDAMAVFAASADYSGAGQMKTRPESCSAPRLERTLLTLREWWRAIDVEQLSGDQAWGAKPRVGTSAKPPQRHMGQVDMAEEALRILRGGDEPETSGVAGGGDGGARNLFPAR